MLQKRDKTKTGISVVRFSFSLPLILVLLMKQPKAVGLKEAMLGDEFTFFVKNYLFIWPHSVLVAAHVNSHLCCGM